eukprot:CAMPEP_0181311304 /NCGR_PEP_ID=MMETSP1101-20121128/13061_1 /TAXON_ID=46948 /ORGANISM="Rhodomonas abbreviata, Strain Caron Lab Isolate" /LENGTH=619 /DNA_ID=CAMNT_0023418017 /DNA_START=316 /DNA_END=2176 /DNA_ORIENTATION=-
MAAPNTTNPTNYLVKNGYHVKTWGDGSRYEGEWVDDMMTGRGFMVWADGRRYDGEWYENRCNGRGVLTYKDGRRYEGEYKMDKMHGRGVYIWAEGARYEGEYKEDKKNGRGVQTWPSGARYEGEYVDSMQTGYGLMTWADGRRYEGYWVNSKCTGFGILTHKDGRRYEGEYVNDKMQGHGVYTWANGAKYDGEYKDNKKNGRGVHTWPDGSMYEGEYLDGMQTGQGYMAWGDGREGGMGAEQMQGYGVLTHADGRRYEGYYLKDKMHGHGVYTWPDGRKYNGEYKNNLKHGNGVWTWPDGVMLEGQWADNLPCRHACTIIFSSYVSTTEVQPRIGLDTDTTLQKLWEDAHAWRQEHNVVHETRRAAAVTPKPRILEIKSAHDDDEVAPRGAAVASVNSASQGASDGARASGGPPGDYIQGANSASVDVGRSADQSTEMFRALRSVAVQLDQGLAEMEEMQSLLDEQTEESSPGMGPPSSKSEAGKGACGPASSSAGSTAKLMSLRLKLVQQVQMLHLELDRHGGAERLVASASKGAGSADAGDSDEFPAPAPSLRETSLREMSLDKVCEALGWRGLGRYVEVFRAKGLDGAQLSEMDELKLAQLGVEHGDRAIILNGLL